jgi:hypothetical protein
MEDHRGYILVSVHWSDSAQNRFFVVFATMVICRLSFKDLSIYFYGCIKLEGGGTIEINTVYTYTCIFFINSIKFSNQLLIGWES